MLTGLDALRDERGMVVILVAHAQIEKFANPETENYDRYVPRLHKLASALVQEWCDEVLFATYRVHTRTATEGFDRKRVQGVGTGERVLRTTERPAHVAKNRLTSPTRSRSTDRLRAVPGGGARAEEVRPSFPSQSTHKEKTHGRPNFNANDVEPNVGFDPVPAGKYLAVITASEMKPTKNGNGSSCELEFQIVEGDTPPHSGRA